MSPNNLGKKLLVEDCQRINIVELLSKYKFYLKEYLIKSELECINTKIELITSRTGYDGVRFWFRCPICSRRMGILYKHPFYEEIACRKCLKLEYKKRRFKGMLEDRVFSKLK